MKKNDETEMTDSSPAELHNEFAAVTLVPVSASEEIAVCTDNLNAGVAVMKSAQDGA